MKPSLVDVPVLILFFNRPQQLSQVFEQVRKAPVSYTHLAKGLFWGGLSNGVQQLLNLFFGIFLSRILNAEDYGMVGMLSDVYKRQELAFAAGDAAKAESYFKQAASKNANAPEVNANIGLCELVKGNVAAAETYLGKATGANAAGEALGNLYIKQGQYDRCV